MNRTKLFVVKKCYGVHEKLVRLIERICDGGMVKFERENVTGECESGVRQCCPLSPLLFNIYVRELGKVISNFVHGVKYAVVGKDGDMEWNGFRINEREQQYVHMKSQPKNEKYANGSMGARVRLMVRGRCLPVRGSKGMEW